MLLTSWVRSFRQSLQTRRRGVRRGIGWQRQALHGDSGRRCRSTELLEERTLLTAFVVDQQYVNANSGSINISNSTIDVDSDGTPEFDSIVFDDIFVSGIGGVGININISDLTLTRIAFQDVQVGDQANGDDQTSGINITLNNVDIDSIAFDLTTVFSAFGGGVDIDLTDVQANELAVFRSTITAGGGAGLTLDIDTASRNSTIDELTVSGSTIDGVALTATGLRKSITNAFQESPLRLTVPGHGLQDGTEVVVTGVSGLTQANTRDTITVVNGSSIQLANTNGLVGSPYISGGTVSVVSSVGNVRFDGNRIAGTSGADGLSISLTDVEVSSFVVSQSLEIDSVDLSLTRTPIDGLTLQGNRIDADRPQVDAVSIDLTQSTLSNLIIDGNTIANTNGGLSGGDGIVFTAADSNVFGSITGNVISGMLGNAIQFDGTASTTFVDLNRGPQVFDFNSMSAESPLAAALSSTATTLQVIDGRAFQAQQVILIDKEQLVVQAVNGNTLTVVRGERGTLPLSHSAGARVRSVTSAASGDRHSIADNIIQNSTGAGIFAVLPTSVSIDASITGNNIQGNSNRAIDITAADTIAPETTLQRGGISRTETILRVVDASVFSHLTLPFDVQVEGETMTVTAVNGNELTVLRAIGGTEARFHDGNVRVVSLQGDAVNLQVGTANPADRNIFDQNRNGQIFIELQDKTGASVSIVNNVLTRSEGVVPEAISISLTSVDTSVEATNILRRSEITGNLIGVDTFALLLANLPAGLTVFTVSDASVFRVGDQLRIENELIQVTTPPSGNTLTVVRGVAGTTNSAHGIGTVVLPTTGGNNGRGVSVFLDVRSTIEDLLIANNVIANQADDGIRFRREGDAETRTYNPHDGQSRAVSVIANSIIANARNPSADAQGVAGAPNVLSGGVEVQALNGGQDSFDIEITGNDILAHRAGGSVNGINLRAEADALILADIVDNVIRFNIDDGINTTDRNQSTDDRDIFATILKNNISDNDGNGIEFNTSTGGQQVVVIGLSGIDPVDGRFYGNNISNNGQEGILVNSGAGGSRISIAGNTINENGQITATAGSDLVNRSNTNALGRILGSGILIDTGGTDIAIKDNDLSSNNGAGIDFDNGGTFSVRNNNITFNQSDGIEFSGSTEAAILGNFIGSNQGRGIDILVGGSTSNYMIGDGQESGRNRITGNAEEGIYFVSSAGTQDQNVLSQNVLSQGAGGNSAFTLAGGGSANAIFQVDTNTIQSNGVGTNSPTTGLYVRIGSSGGGGSPYRNDTGSGTGYGSQDDLTRNGRTNARIVNNTLGGNFGEDVRFETFVSTTAPGTTTGNWGNGINPVSQRYTGPGYNSDPLARLNLVFQGNSGDGLNATAGGGSYNNPEPTWKSRDSVNTGSDLGGPSGPFGNGGTRPRSILQTPSRNTQTPNFNAVLNPAPDAIFNITNVSPVDIGNGVTELVVTLSNDIFGVYFGALPDQIQSGDSVEIRNVNPASGVQHSANGIFFIDVISRTANSSVIHLRGTPDDNGPAYLSGGQAIFNLNTSTLNPTPNQTSQFMYPGTGRSTLRIAQGADTV
ncbi:MAG: right-handed parallel beta-helix repeat-containing protein, partial [Planctomycetota bacterium]|nr:right-handed parallel beta-helix repeat-containing protein [Planctomycetota bacterium]